MTAYLFNIRQRQGSQFIGQALVCPEARYFSVSWRTPALVVRLHPSAREWKAVVQLLDANLPSSPLHDTSVIAQLIGSERAPQIAIQFLASLPVDERPERVAMLLDQRLRMLQL